MLRQKTKRVLCLENSSWKRNAGEFFAFELFRFDQFIEASESLLLIFLFAHPKLLAVLHYVGQHRTAKEHHMLLTRRILDFNFEFLNNWIRPSESNNQFLNEGRTKNSTDNRWVSPLSTLSRYNWVISRSRRLANPGYMVVPPLSTICL